MNFPAPVSPPPDDTANSMNHRSLWHLDTAIKNPRTGEAELSGEDIEVSFHTHFADDKEQNAASRTERMLVMKMPKHR